MTSIPVSLTPDVQSTIEAQIAIAAEAIRAIKAAIRTIEDPAIGLGFGIQAVMLLLETVPKDDRHEIGKQLARVAANKLNAMEEK